MRKKKQISTTVGTPNLRKLVNQSIPNASEASGGVALLVLEALLKQDALDDGDLRSGRVEAAEDSPVVGDEARADRGVTAVNGSGYDGDLQEGGELVHVADGGLGVDDAALIGDYGVATDEGVVGDGGTEGLHLQRVANDLLRLLAKVGVEEGDVVVGAHAVAEGGEALLNALNFNAVGEGVAEVLELLVGGDGGDYEAVAVTDAEATDDAGAADAGVDDRNVVSELLLKDRVEVLAGAGGNEAVGVGEASEDADVIG